MSLLIRRKVVTRCILLVLGVYSIVNIFKVLVPLHHQKKKTTNLEVPVESERSLSSNLLAGYIHGNNSGDTPTSRPAEAPTLPPVEKTQPPVFTVMVNNRSVVPTVPAVPAAVSIRRGDPGICRSSQALKWIFYIHTAPKNKERRNTIRKTWGDRFLFKDRRTAVIFLVGLPRDEEERKMIDYEYEIYGDMVQGDFVEDYRNLTYKGILGLQFIAKYCSHVPYAIKSDDDVYANVFKIMELCESRGPDQRFLMCFRWVWMPILRPGDQPVLKKWWLDNDILPGKKFFPPYCAGLGWFFSTNIVQDLLNVTKITPYLWVDDAYISGMVMNQVPNLTLVNLLKVVPYASVLGSLKHFNSSQYVLSHKRPKTVREFWNHTLHQIPDEVFRELNLTRLSHMPGLLARRQHGR